MCVDQELDQLDILRDRMCLTDDDIEMLNTLSTHDNKEIRYLVADLLCKADYTKADPILLSMLNDRDYLVRVNVCDSLRASRDEKLLETLKRVVVRDRSYLVRHYAVQSIGDIALNSNANKNELLNFLEQRLAYEKSEHTKIAFFRTMFLLGEQKYFKCILDQLHNAKYQIRCAAINTLADIANHDNMDRIIDALVRLDETEKTVAVASTISQALSDFEQTDSQVQTITRK